MVLYMQYIKSGWEGKILYIDEVALELQTD